MTSWEQNVEAYHIVADMLVNFRRIVERGLEKCAGKNFYRDGCPPEIVQRLVARQDLEGAIDRYGHDNDNLITFATFEDLADFLDANDDLAQLLAGLSPKDETMTARLRSLEVLRRKLAAAVPFNDDDIEILSVFHQEFRAALARRRVPTGAETLTSTVERLQEEQVEREQPTSSPRDAVAAAAEKGAAEAETESPPAETPDDEPVPAEDVVSPSEMEASVALPPDEGESADWGEAPSDDYGTKAGKLATAPIEVDSFTSSADGAAEADLAMADDDDAGVLRALHREVTSVAEGVFEMDADRSHAVWESLRASGWYDIKLGELALAPLELFYAVAEEARDKKNAGVGDDEIREFLADAHFTKLLFSLREMFLRQEL